MIGIALPRILGSQCTQLSFSDYCNWPNSTDWCCLLACDNIKIYCLAYYGNSVTIPLPGNFPGLVDVTLLERTDIAIFPRSTASLSAKALGALRNNRPAFLGHTLFCHLSGAGSWETLYTLLDISTLHLYGPSTGVCVQSRL
jgi:hypothetical protein